MNTVPTVSGRPFRVGRWLVDPRSRRVEGVDGAPAERLEPKVLGVLLDLVEHAGQTRSRQDLLRRAWPDVVVGDEVLTRSISVLRRTFGDDGEAYIETIPKTGYRLVAPVEPVAQAIPSGEPGPERPRSAASWHLPRASWAFAVLLPVAAAALALLSPDGGSGELTLEALTDLPGRETQPSLSGDGHLLAYVHKTEDGGADLFVQRLPERRPQRLTETPDAESRPAISPDGTEVAFVRRGPARCSLYRHVLRTGTEERLADCGSVSSPSLAWSPDGRTIVFNDRPTSAEPYALFRVRPDRAGVERITRPPAGTYGDHQPAFAPDGRTLAFCRGGFGVEDVHLANADGGGPRALTHDRRKVAGLAWEPDGSAVVIASDRGGSFALWRVPIDGSGPERLLLGSPGVALLNPAFARDGRFVYEERSSQATLWRLEVPGAASATRLARSSRNEWAPDLSPRGDEVAFVSDRSGEKEVWVAPLAGGAPKQLTRLRAAYVDRPRWSPDGTEIAFAARTDDSADVHVVQAGGEVRRLTQGSWEDLVPSWSRDGRFVYFASDRSGTVQVWRVPARGGEAEQVTTDGGFVAIESADGRLYHSRYLQAGLWSRAGDGRVEAASPAPSAADWANWLPVRDGIVSAERARGGARILLRPFAGGGERVLADLPGTGELHGIAASPAGTTLVVSQLERDESDVVLARRR